MREHSGGILGKGGHTSRHWVFDACSQGVMDPASEPAGSISFKPFRRSDIEIHRRAGRVGCFIAVISVDGGLRRRHA
jgi:hypothetical protein